MFSIKILKQEIKFLNEKIKTLTKISFTTDTYASLEINDLRMLIQDLEDAVSTLKEKHLITN